MPNVRWLLALITAVHRWVYLKTGGRIGHKLGRQPMLLLHTVGRRSGEPRTTPLLYVPDAADVARYAATPGSRACREAPRWPRHWVRVCGPPDPYTAADRV